MSIFTDAVQKHDKLILDAQNYIWANAETGYREVKTSKYMADAFESLGYTLIKPDDITGFYTVIDTGKEGPEVLILGELDSLICPDHPDADKQTGAVHCCGHSAQCAALLGIAADFVQYLQRSLSKSSTETALLKKASSNTTAARPSFYTEAILTVLTSHLWYIQRKATKSLSVTQTQ